MWSAPARGGAATRPGTRLPSPPPARRAASDPAGQSARWEVAPDCLGSRGAGAQTPRARSSSPPCVLDLSGRPLLRCAQWLGPGGRGGGAHPGYLPGPPGPLCAPSPKLQPAPGVYSLLLRSGTRNPAGISSRDLGGGLVWGPFGATELRPCPQNAVMLVTWATCTLDTDPITIL